MNNYLQQSLLVLNSQQNKINTEFFSNQNISKIQKQLILETKKYTGYTISKQNCDDVVTAMQYFYVNYPQYTIDDSKAMENVNQLNALVIDDLTRQTVSGVKQHIEYLKYIKRTPEPLEYGTNTGIKGQNSLETGDFGL